MIRAAEIPAPLLHAFVDAMEAWGHLEHELFMIWQLLKRSTNIDKAWEEFSRLSTSEQRKSTIKLVEEHRHKTQFAASLPSVFDRLAELTKTRDRIVHGRWHKIHVEGSFGRQLEPEYIRLYDARGEPSRPLNTDDEQRMLGRSRFYETQSRETQAQFREAARDLHLAKANVIGWRSNKV